MVEIKARERKGTLKRITCRMCRPGNDRPCIDYQKPTKPGEPGFCARSTMLFCTEWMKRYLPPISENSVTDFMSCHLKFYHSTVEGIDPKPEHLPEAVKIGKIWAVFIRHLHDGYNYQADAQSLKLSPEQWGKISGLMKAYQDLEIKTQTEGLIGCHLEVHVPVTQTQIIGYVQRAYETFIKESRISSRPDFYQQKETLTYPLGIRFLSNEDWGYADVEITRTPTLKMKEGEDAEEYAQRVYSDVIGRPAYYFMRWDRRTRTFGVRFWRTEFDLREVYFTYVTVLREIEEALEKGSWYGNHLACHVPSTCRFFPIRRSGVVSEEIFEQRHKKGGETP